MKYGPFRLSVSWSKTIFTLVALAILTISAAKARGWLVSGNRSVEPVPVPQVEPTNHTGAHQSRPSVESEVITLTPTGFNPSQITRPPGRFLVLIDNQSGLEEVNFTLNREDGQRLRAARRTKEELIWRQLEDLPPGEYRLNEASHPEWICRITIKRH